MLTQVPTPDVRELDDYRVPAGDDAVDRLQSAAAPLAGARLLHVSSTAFGGGVAELIPTQIAIMRALGIDADWRLLDGSEEFFSITKLAHNALQGGAIPWTEAMESSYLNRIAANAARFDEDADFVIVHDPQPVALLSVLEEEGRRTGRWVWRCHIDLSDPMEAVWSFYARHAAGYDAAIFTAQEFVREGLLPRVVLIPPGIDPLAPKNGWLDDASVAEILGSYGVDPKRPIMTQVSRFDPWKDPLGVIDAYRMASAEVPDLQLILVGSMAHDDPEGWAQLERTEEHRGGDLDIHVLTNLQAVGALAVNAFQRACTVAVQKSLREGFGLTVSEAMWKGKPLVAGNAGGLRLQVDEGKTGFLVSSAEECAERIVDLLRQPELRTMMGDAGRERVREFFLCTREVEDHLHLLASL